MRSTRVQLKGLDTTRKNTTRNNYRVNPGGVIERTRFARVSPERVRFVMRNPPLSLRRIKREYPRLCAKASRRRITVPKARGSFGREKPTKSVFPFIYLLFLSLSQLPPPFQLPSVEGSSLSLTLIRTYRSGIGDRGGSMKGKVPHEGGGHLVVYRTSS